MNLYTNGCSFTHGHDPGYDADGTYTLLKYNDFEFPVRYKINFAWPWRLSHLFDNVFNHALGGSGPHRMVRTTINFVEYLRNSGEDLSQWIFALQISQSQRLELLHTSDEWISYFSLHGEHPYSLAYELPDQARYDFCEKHDDIESDVWLHDYLTKHAVMALNDEEVLNRTLNEILQIVFYMEAHGLKYLITGMVDENHKPDSIVTDSVHNKQLLDAIPTHNFIDSIVSKIDEKRLPCGHPDATGHGKFSSYLESEILKRGWL